MGSDIKPKTYACYIKPKTYACYLCGPIDGVSPKWATKWREQASEYLNKHGIRTLDPTSGKDLDMPGINDHVYFPEEIVTADLAAIDKSDIILVDWRKLPLVRRIWNFIRTGHSDPLRVGSIMEIKYARIKGKLIISFGKMRRGYWLRYHVEYSFLTLDAALSFIKKVVIFDE